MSANTGIQSFPEWKQYLLLAERLLEQPSVKKQCQLIEEIIYDLFGADSHTWLNSPYFPLPGDPAYAVLPAVKTKQLVKKAFDEQLDLFASGQALSNIVFDNRRNPHQLAIPLVSQNNMLGILEINRTKGPSFNQQEISFLEGLASHAAVSMQIIRQVKIKNWRMEQLSLVRMVAEQIANVLNIDELSKRITQLIQSTFNYYYVAIFLVNGKKRSLDLQADSSINDQTEISCDFSVQMGEGIIGFVAKSGRELIAADVKQESLYKQNIQLPATKSEAAFPLKINKKILGVLDLQSDQADSFHEYDIAVLRSLANSIAIAVQDASLYSSLHKRAEQIGIIFEVSNAINSILDLDELLQKIILTIKKQYQNDEIRIYTIHGGRRKIFFQLGVDVDNTEIFEGDDYDIDDPQGIIPWVARSGISAMTNNAEDDGRFTLNEESKKIDLSQMVVPLQYTDEILGILQIQNKNADVFDEQDLFLIEAIASTISTALRNANLFRSEQWRHQVADSFRHVLELISNNTALDELLSNILIQLNNNLPCDASSIWLIDSKDEPAIEFSPSSLRLAATWGVDKEKLLTILIQQPESWRVLEMVIQDNSPVIRSSQWQPGPIGIAKEFPPDYSSISVPLRIGDDVLGILSMAHHTANRYGAEAKDMTVTFANYAAIAIQSARLFSDSQEQAWISTVLLQVAQTCQASTNPDDLFQSMSRLTPLMVGIHNCAFFEWDNFQKVLKLKAQYGLELQDDSKWDSNFPAVKQLIQSLKPVFIQQPLDELAIDCLDFKIEESTCVLLPLQVRGELLGAFLVIHEGNKPNNLKFSSQTLSILQGIAQQTALTLDNMRLLEARQEEAYITAVMLQVAQAVVSQANLEDTFDTIVNLLPILIGVDACAIYLPTSDEEGKLILTNAYADQELDLQSFQSNQASTEMDLLKFVANTAQIGAVYLPNGNIEIENWLNLPPVQVIEEDSFKITANMLIAFPIVIKTELLGILLTKERNLAPQYFFKRIELLAGVSQEIALAIQNYQLQLDNVAREKLEQEIDLARQIQKTFLPDHIPVMEGWKTVTKWETARQVGGDFYDIFPISESKFGLVIADVADKGLAASLYMTVSRTLIRAFGQTMDDPASVLFSVNNLLTIDAPGGLFVTAIFAILNIENGNLIYTNAGHNLPILFKAQDGLVVKMPKGNMALGVVENIEYKNHEIQIDAGDIFLLYTDGLTESFSKNGEIFGTKRLEEIIADCKKDKLENLMEKIDIELDTFRGGLAPSDDLTLIAIKRDSRS